MISLYLLFSQYEPSLFHHFHLPVSARLKIHRQLFDLVKRDENSVSPWGVQENNSLYTKVGG